MEVLDVARCKALDLDSTKARDDVDISLLTVVLECSEADVASRVPIKPGL
jgi:hypothetical protein